MKTEKLQLAEQLSGWCSKAVDAELFVLGKTHKHRSLISIQSPQWVLFEQVKSLPLSDSLLFFHHKQLKPGETCVCASPAADAVSLHQAAILMRSDKISPGSSARACLFSPHGWNASCRENNKTILAPGWFWFSWWGLIGQQQPP